MGRHRQRHCLTRGALRLFERPSLKLPPHLLGRLVLAQSDVNRVTQEVVCSPGQIGDLGDKLRLDRRPSRRRAGTSAVLLEPGGNASGYGAPPGNVIAIRNRRAWTSISRHPGLVPRSDDRSRLNADHSLRTIERR
jgi:hypothetical protein